MLIMTKTEIRIGHTTAGRRGLILRKRTVQAQLFALKSASALPLAWPQITDQRGRMVLMTRSMTSRKVHERVDLHLRSARTSGTQDSGSVRRRFAPSEKPVPAAHYDRPGAPAPPHCYRS